MELYGRPQVARRNTSPSISFLNDAKTRSVPTVFTPPNSSRNQETDAAAAVEVGGRTGGARGSEAPSPEATAMLFDHTRPPPLSRPPLERPQSGGVRRPAPGAPPLSASATKQRPRTARESSRALNRLTPSSASSSDFEFLFARRQSESSPEVDGAESDRLKQKGGPTDAAASRDEAYIRQLKADIVYCHHVLSQQTTQSIGSTYLTPKSHTHVKNVQSMRESRLPHYVAPANLDAALHSQLARYNFSSDAVQLQSAKAKLEDVLAQALTKVMRQFLELREDQVNPHDDSAADEDHERYSMDSIGLQRPSGNQLAFANGCGSDSASIYSGCLVGVLQRVEEFRAMIVGLNSEKACLLKTIGEKDRTAERLNEQLELFKDALAKSIAKRSSTGVGHLRRAVNSPYTEHSSATFEEISKGQVFDYERELELSAHVQSLEKERVRLEEDIRRLRSEQELALAELQHSRAEADQHAHTAAAVQAQLEECMANSARERQVQEQQARELHSSVKTLTVRCRDLEESSNHEKQTLRSDKQVLELRIRKLEEELRGKANLVGQSATTLAELKRSRERAESLSIQLKKVEEELVVSQIDVTAARSESEKRRESIAQLEFEFNASTSRIKELTMELEQADLQRSTQASALRQTELKLSQAQADVERHAGVIHHQENQLTLLETRLSRSVSVTEDEERRRKNEDETAWHQKLAALEHALAVERQTNQSLKDQHTASIAMERERAEHTVSQAKGISLELETANLCLAERKRQREKELQEFASQKSQLLDRISRLISERDEAMAAIAHHQQLQAQARTNVAGAAQRDELETRIEALQNQLAEATANAMEVRNEATARLDQLRAEFETKQQGLAESYRQSVEDEIESFKSAAENALTAELAVRQQLEVVIAERDVLLHKLQGERSTPRGSALSEARVELQRAKLKITALEERLSKIDTARGKDSEGKAAVMAAREKKLADDQKSLKKVRQEVSADKKQVRSEREALDNERSRVEADKLRNKDEHQLLRQIIPLLVTRLSLQMELLRIIPPELATAQRDLQSRAPRSTAPPSSLIDFIHKFQREHGDQWRDMQLKWATLQQELDDVDWQLIHMRNRLEELNVHALPAVASAPARPKTPLTSPFSDAVAAGKDTVPVAEQLASASKPAATPAATGFDGKPHKSETGSEQLPSSAARVRDEDHETFAIALAKEMRAMKESYEIKLDELQHEIRKVQKLRMQSAQRLRVELDDEKQRNQQIIAQLTDRCASLEAQLQALQRAFALAQDRQIELLHEHNSATTEAARSRILRALHVAVAEACKEEMTKREAREQDRVRKLQDYCGSSSVAVEREDKKRIL